MKTVPLILLTLASLPAVSRAEQIDMTGPMGSVHFGEHVHLLPNGNIVATDPDYQSGRGAVHLLTPRGTVISTLSGAGGEDHLGSGRIVVLPGGNFVVCNPSTSRSSDSGPIRNVGSATWVDGRLGLNGTVSDQNSLMGSSVNDVVGVGCQALRGGAYVVLSPSWNNGSVEDAGAVTWGSSAGGVSGTISAANSVVGTSNRDAIGAEFVELENGNGVIAAQTWDSELNTVQAGAAVWMDGEHGTAGEISSANALTGSAPNDRVGTRIVPLTNGSYYVISMGWHDPDSFDGLGAMTWCSGSAPCIGEVSSSNSLIGMSAGDMVDAQGLALANGKMLAMMPSWNNSADQRPGAGAVMVLPSDGSTVGPVERTSLLYGAAERDHFGKFAVALDNGNAVAWSDETHIIGETNGVGVSFVDSEHPATGPVLLERTLSSRTGGVGTSVTVTALRGGRYAVACPDCTVDGVARAGAVVWGGVDGVTGWIDGVNSLHGTSVDDHVGTRVVALTNGNYVVASPLWNGVQTPDSGAVTWVHGATGIPQGEAGVGIFVGGRNSLTSEVNFDRLGSGGIVALSNGDFVVGSPEWHYGTVEAAGAITRASGATGFSDRIAIANSLFGTSANDRVGDHLGERSVVLDNGAIAVASPDWDESRPGVTIADVGAVTWLDGNSTLGAISIDNSFLGRTTGDHVGFALRAAEHNQYLIQSPDVHYCTPTGVCLDDTIGATSAASGSARLRGRVARDNSVFGYLGNGGSGSVVTTAAFDGERHLLVVGQPEINVVSLLTLEKIFSDSFE